MKRRDLLAGAGLGIIAAGADTYAALRGDPAKGPAAAPTNDAKREWRMITCWPENFPGLGTGAANLARRITAMSGGRLTVKVFPAGTVVPALGVFDAVSQGVAEMGHSAAHYWQGKSKAFNFFAAVPFGLTANELSAWIHFGGGQELWDEGYAGFGLKSFLCGNTGVQMGGWFRRPMKSIEDFRGIKMRMPGLGGEVLRRLGATAENLPGGEVFQALASGRIDATEWAGPWNDLALGFYRITKNYYWPGFHEPGSGIECMVNKARFDALPPDLKIIVAEACRAEAEAMLGEYNRRNAQALKVLLEKHGVQLRRFPGDIMTALGHASETVLAELEGADDLTRRTYRSFRAFRDAATAWSHIAERSYLEMRAEHLAKIR
jgi:TRAP-type mannitol/chloroaromatic compound transport system substrate-binding protein